MICPFVLTLIVILFGITGRLLFQPLLVVDAQAFTPGGAVVVTVHQHGPGGQVTCHSVAVFFAPCLQRRVRGFSGEAKIFQVQEL